MMDRQLNSLASEFHQNLTGTPQRREPLENEPDRLLDSTIGMELDFSAWRPTVSRRQVALEFAAPRFLAHRFK
jgi:hypothetical protein